MSIYVAIPCMDQIDTEFVQSLLRFKLPPQSAYGITVASLTYDARNTLADAVIKSDFDKVMWCDSDMVFEPDTITRLEADIDEGRDFVTGLYVTRKEPIRPVIFKSMGYKTTPDGLQESYAGFYDDYPRDDIFEIEAAGFGCVMTTAKLLKGIVDKYGSAFNPLPGFGEDMSFCKRCREQGYTLYCDSRIKVGHIGTKVYTEDDLS